MVNRSTLQVKTIFSCSGSPPEPCTVQSLDDLYLPGFQAEKVLIADTDTPSIKVLDLNTQDLKTGVTSLVSKVYVTSQEAMYEYDLTNEELPFIEAGSLPDKVEEPRSNSQLSVDPEIENDPAVSDLD